MKMPSQRRCKSQRGVTLIELLLAVTLFALIGVTSAIVLRTGFDSLDRIEAKVDEDRRVLGAERALDQMLRGMVPVNAPCAGKPTVFQGGPNFVRFITSHSLAEGSRGRLQFVELIVEAKGDNTGFRLVVNEYPYLNRAMIAPLCAQPPVVRATSFILADQLSACRFFFKRLEAGMAVEQWYPQWLFPELPRAIRVELIPNRVLENRARAQRLNIPVMVRNVSYQ
jgi:prepilin-type N-terminal cleavage/methylation domain-containing protein